MLTYSARRSWQVYNRASLSLAVQPVLLIQYTYNILRPFYFKLQISFFHKSIAPITYTDEKKKLIWRVQTTNFNYIPGYTYICWQDFQVVSCLCDKTDNTTICHQARANKLSLNALRVFIKHKFAKRIIIMKRMYISSKPCTFFIASLKKIKTSSRRKVIWGRLNETTIYLPDLAQNSELCAGASGLTTVYKQETHLMWARPRQSSIVLNAKPIKGCCAKAQPSSCYSTCAQHYRLSCVDSAFINICACINSNNTQSSVSCQVCLQSLFQHLLPVPRTQALYLLSFNFLLMQSSRVFALVAWVRKWIHTQ